jgi:hypothetical protein
VSVCYTRTVVLCLEVTYRVFFISRGYVEAAVSMLYRVCCLVSGDHVGAVAWSSEVLYTLSLWSGFFVRLLLGIRRL